ncbi:unnamed protein product [Pieris macdunnoughi]|uniref:Endonuclease/exonuclease/phosphatase domain-containing protein n=1 Tax=Pieris macdunnoughi TaxID=345717 RepID=A0A821RX37_9NEOP|nr:unnamed protein product [Pieris macdunnoughi]
MEVDTKESRLPCEPPSQQHRAASGASGGKWTTGHVGVRDQAPRGNNTTGNSVKLRKIQKIGTWNVRGFLKPGKLNIVEREVTRCGLSICGLTETHWRSNGHFFTDAHAVYFSSSDDSSQNGVAILIPKHQNNSVIGYEAVSDRIMSMKLKASPVNLNLIQAYAPTSEPLPLVLESFYQDLQATIAKIPNRELLIIMGDFNAKIGSNSAQYSKSVGNFGLGVRNERGERFTQFADENNMNQKSDQLHTDKITLATSILNAHTLPGADCGSNHELVIAKMRLKLKAARSSKKTRRIEVADNEKFTTAIERSWTDWTVVNHTDATPDTLWNKAKQLIQNAVTESSPGSETCKRQHWMTDSTLALIEEGRFKKAAGADIRELNRLSANIQACCRRDHNFHLHSICDELEKHHVSRDLYHKIRLITKSLPAKTWAIENDKNEVVTELEQISETWRSYCQSLFLDAQSRLSISTEPEPENLEPDILLSEVRTAIKHLKSNKATGRDAIPIETIKALGERGDQMFHLICNKVSQTGVWPSEWTHTIFTPLHKKGSTKKCNNYRLIARIPHASEILLHILNERLKA